MRLVFTALAALLLAGCAGTGSGPTEGPPGTAPTPAALIESRAERPAWEIGQGWIYTVERPGEPTHRFEMMVAEDRDDLWVVASDNRSQAIHHAIYSTNPVLGRIGKATLSPFQGGAPVTMFPFPLTDGKSWEAQFFGESMRFRADYAGDIDTSMIAASRNLPKRLDGFRIAATGGTGTKVLYDYVEAVEWFTSFELLDKGGVREIKLTLFDFTDRYVGPYHFVRGAPDDRSLSERATNEQAPTMVTLAATVPDGFSDVLGVGIHYLGTASTPPPRAEIVLKRPDGTEAWRRTLDGARQVPVLVDFPGVKGKWSFELTLVGTVAVDVRAVGMKTFAEGSL